MSTSIEFAVVENTAASDSTTPIQTPPSSPNSQAGAAKKETYNGCIMCDKKASLRCPTCGTWYCCRECYRRDWPDHKILCNTLKDDFSDANRPPNRVRAILFPLFDTRPTFVWVDKSDLYKDICLVLGIDEEGRRRKELVVSYDDFGGVRKDNRFNKRNVDLWPFRSARSKTANQSILALGKPGHMKFHRGAFLICAQEAAGFSDSSSGWVDATLGDFRDILDSCRHNEENPCIVDPVRFPLEEYYSDHEKAELWPAVKLNCEGDIACLSVFCGEGKTLDLAENVLVLSKELKDKRIPCVMPRLAGLPWVMQYCSATNSNLKKEDLHNYGGRVFAPGEQYHEVDGAPTMLPSTYCGTIIVMHEKGAPIYHSHVLCFYDFFEVQLRQLTVNSAHELGPGTHRIFTNHKQLEDRITKETFLKYWNDWVTEKMKGAENELEYSDLCSPYDFEEMEEDRKDLEEAMRALEVDSKKEHEKALAEAKRDLGIVD